MIYRDKNTKKKQEGETLARFFALSSPFSRDVSASSTTEGGRFRHFNLHRPFICHFFSTFARMKPLKPLLLCFFLTGSLLQGQTIIDLKPGGGVRAKTAEEYRKDEPGLAEKLKADSLQYNDNLTRALNALYRDSIADAERLLQEALRLRPNAPANTIVKHYLGRIEMARGDYRKAIHYFTPLLKDQPDNRAVRFDRAACYLEIKNNTLALEDCQTLLQKELLPEERIKALFLRSAIYTGNRQADKAKADLEEVLRLEPTNVSAQLLMAFAYKDLGQPMEALNRLNLFVAQHPQNTEGWTARAQLEEQLQMNDAARADYEKAIQLSPKNATLYISKAQLLLKMGLPNLAKKDITQAIRLGYPADAALRLLPQPSE